MNLTERNKMSPASQSQLLQRQTQTHTDKIQEQKSNKAVFKEKQILTLKCTF